MKEFNNEKIVMQLEKANEELKNCRNNYISYSENMWDLSHHKKNKKMK